MQRKGGVDNMTIDHSFVKSEIDNAEKQFDICFNTLANMKSSSIEGLFDFQSTLADALHRLMTIYKKTIAQEKLLIKTKADMVETEFVEAIKSLHRYKEILKETIDIGKSLGDSFAWTFYAQSSDELVKHLNHPETGLFPAGIGGRGEIEFIKQNQTLFGCFVIYHGITSMLRIGDFSLYAPSDRKIIATGELKSEIQGKDLNISAYISSKAHLHSEKFEVFEGEPKEYITSTVFQRERLLRQIENIDDLLKPIKTEYDYNHIRARSADFEMPPLSGEIHFKLNEDKTLLTSIFHSGQSSIFDTLFLSGNYQHSDLEHSESLVKEMVVQDSGYNYFSISQLDSKIHQSRMPILWWDIDIDFIKNVLFKKVIVIMLFNPAKLYDHYERKGFSIKSPDDFTSASFEKIIEDRRLKIGNLFMYFDMIVHSFFPTNSIIETLDHLIEKTLNGPPGTHITIMPHQQI